MCIICQAKKLALFFSTLLSMIITSIKKVFMVVSIIDNSIAVLKLMFLIFIINDFILLFKITKTLLLFKYI